MASMFHVSIDTISPIAFNRTLDWTYGDVREVWWVSVQTVVAGPFGSLYLCSSRMVATYF